MRPASGLLLAFVPLGLGMIGIASLSALPPQSVRLAGYATGLSDRTRAQRHNAVLAARSLNGAVIPANGEFSFNKTVKTWSMDRGYVRAPVSYDGALVPAFGGGVCQTSTTLYNAALLAGLTPMERHHHVFAPHYVPPGRDAAVAYPNIDLRFRNPYPFSMRIRANVNGDTLSVEIWGKKVGSQQYKIASRVLTVNEPTLVRRAIAANRDRPDVARYAGTAGYRVITERLIYDGERENRRERLSDDSYPSMPDIITFAR